MQGAAPPRILTAVDFNTDGRLTEHVRAARSTQASYVAIARSIEDEFGVKVSYETVRQFVLALALDGDAA